MIVALLIAMGSATSLLSCKAKKVVEDPETFLTQQSDSLTVIESKNGRKTMYMHTPQMNRYELAKEPYTEFPMGLEVITYRDSTGEVESSLVADYAINYEKRKLWEARGNVIGKGADGRTLYTEQLFWNERTGRVYSNIDSKVIQGDEVFVGDGFESDDKFEHWEFRNFMGKMAIDPSPSDGADSLATDSLAVDSLGTAALTDSVPARATATPTPRPTPPRPAPAPRPMRQSATEVRAQDEALRLQEEASTGSLSFQQSGDK